MKRFAAFILMLCMLAVPLSADAFQASSQVGTDVSGFSSTDIAGNSIDGSIFNEYPVSVVCYLATWSPYFASQLQILNTIHNDHPEYGVFGLLLVDATSTPEVALEVMTTLGCDFTVFVLDETWESVVSESVFIPQSFIVNRGGVIVEAWQAAFDNAEILEGRLELWSVPFADGDADGNGIVELADALMILRCAMGVLPVDDAILFHGDVNGNGELDVNDSLTVLRIALGILTRGE